MAANINNIGLYSNLKLVTSNTPPTDSYLGPGQMAFGRLGPSAAEPTRPITYHIWANGDYGVVDITETIFNQLMGRQDLAAALARGNEADISILLEGLATVFKIAYNNNEAQLGRNGLQVGDTAARKQGLVSSNEVRLEDMDNTGTQGTSAPVVMSFLQGFLDQGYSVLTSNPERRELTATESTEMRRRLNVMDRDETTALVSSMFDFKGTVDTFELLPPNGPANVGADQPPSDGDVWMTRNDSPGVPPGTGNAAGLLWVWVQPEGGAGRWEKLNYLISLADYWTSAEVRGEIDAAVAGLEGAIAGLQAAIDTLGERMDAVEDAVSSVRTDFDAHVEGIDGNNTHDNMHSQNNFNDTMLGRVQSVMTPTDTAIAAGLLNGIGDGSTFLSCNGRYSTLYVAIERI